MGLRFSLGHVGVCSARATLACAWVAVCVLGGCGDDGDDATPEAVLKQYLVPCEVEWPTALIGRKAIRMTSEFADGRLARQAVFVIDEADQPAATLGFTSYSYDARDRLAQMTLSYPVLFQSSARTGDATVTFTHDSEGRVAEAQVELDDDNTADYRVVYNRDASGRIVEEVARCLDPEETPLVARTYAYTSDGLLAERIDTPVHPDAPDTGVASAPRAYTHDDADRLLTSLSPTDVVLTGAYACWSDGADSEGAVLVDDIDLIWRRPETWIDVEVSLCAP